MSSVDLITKKPLVLETFSNGKMHTRSLATNLLLHKELTLKFSFKKKKTYRLQITQYAKSQGLSLLHSEWPKLYQGSYRQVCAKFKDFSRTSKQLSYCFEGLKTYENY